MWTPKDFSFHASASGISGHITMPFQEPIPVHVASAIPPAGGVSTSRDDGGLNFKEMVKAGAVSTMITGSFSAKDQAWQTVVTVIIEDLDILGTVTATRITSTLRSLHPFPPDDPKRTIQIIPVGSSFEGLKVAGYDVTFEYHDPELETEIGTYEGFRKHLKDKMGYVEYQGKIYGSIFSTACCDAPGITCEGNMITVPQFGKVTLGDLQVESDTRHLTMLKADLGSPVEGNVTCASGTTNGTPHPGGG